MPDPNAQVPTPDELVGKGIDKLVSLRPRALAHINRGMGGYAKVFAGWRAQAALMCRRLADFSAQGRLPFGDGEPLRIFAASEFDAIADIGPTKAVGQVTMTRTGALPGGPIRAGSRFSRAADTSSSPLWSDAQYEAAQDIAVAQGATSVTVPLIAARAGRFANRPSNGAAQTEIAIADNIIDAASWTLTTYEMAGGSDGADDDAVKRYASAFASGQFAPNTRAAIAGALKGGARRVLAFDDPVAAALRLVIADESWAGATRWCTLVRQFMLDNKFVGFGCRVLVDFIRNQLVAIEATCKVRSPTMLADTSELDVSIQKALAAYFDERPDFNRWTLASLRGVIARADRRILSCTSVAVKALDGTVIAEPTSSSTTHYLLLANGVRATYLPPS